MFFGTSTGSACVCTGAALGGGGVGGGGGGGAAAIEYWATCAGELVGKETFQIAPITTARMMTTWRPTETGSVRYFWIPTLCFFDSTTVVSNMVRSALLCSGSRLFLLDDLHGPVADLISPLDVFLGLERIRFRQGLLPP